MSNKAIIQKQQMLKNGDYHYKFLPQTIITPQNIWLGHHLYDYPIISNREGGVLFEPVYYKYNVKKLDQPNICFSAGSKNGIPIYCGHYPKCYSKFI